MVGDGPENDLLDVPEEDLEEAEDLLQGSLGLLNDLLVVMLPAPEAATTARGQVIYHFAVSILGRQTEGNLPIGSDQRVVGVVDVHEELDEWEVADGGGEL